ncbi:MAG: RNA polymerase sigma factor [Bradyrhizobium sp.]|jgi:RNA polymerase sigma-70 factor (ECF subfamily)|uniref:RNA polymerase sigma factor n=1 Tax=Bradyrhizobium denitrificans TaxID=2734912 RepID=A0ABS5G136_9BRAD|nr:MULTISPECIES: RNA polymerase sigma factor [Bradyrhizobium]ABQ39344.1 Putative RNA polymerase sigma factor protein [Bradyrhizobium sp. BTAi1]MBR1134416.1 RNA polymerase sigma factor [Bradyrhizobium denitrificans]MDU0956130.1 RNA polymerase sigma factor [Bradyrhizobium sp.]MDU1491114.1 RNA polymerase sigma factor [Bradyrhizobium sp.]MDU1541292.1 RNA polymerase sigma factor [Bradyrhizobium sp.]
MPWTTTASAVPSGEDDLIRRARARDEAAIRAILQANNRRLFRIARGILRNDSEAEDVVQDTYVRALTHLGEFRGQSSLSTWLVRIAMNEAMGRLRGARPALPLDEQREDKSGAEVIEFRATSSDPEKSVAQRQIQAVVEQAIDDLSEPFRLVFIARVIEEMSIDETADLLGLKPETVKTRLHRARGMLRENVEKEIGPVLLDAFPFAGQRCERLTDAVLRRLGLST